MIGIPRIHKGWGYYFYGIPPCNMTKVVQDPVLSLSLFPGYLISTYKINLSFYCPYPCFVYGLC